MFDIGLALVCLPLLSVPMLLIAALLKATSRDRVLYWSKRVGKGGVIFNMPKFRTLKPIATVSAAATAAPVDRTAHANAAREYESFGKFLRYTSLDELPQLFSILKGDMSFVGPRPIEPVEAGLIALRAEKEVDSLAPGLTGWAQVNGRDLLSDAEKVDFDMQYLSRRSLWLDIKILFITVAQVIRRKNISF
ncbi:MAG: sugar transferase [Gammaproteobacteria bacterium]|nr:sugar transferase [Gammaproteobacteria bacterium]